MTEARALSCPRCGSGLPSGEVAKPLLTLCPGCGTETQVSIFPTLHRGPAVGQKPQLVLGEGEAACFYHSGKVATVPCDACGRFLCALCDVELHGKHYCPACLEAGRAKGQLPSLERGRTRYDQIVWSLLVLPMVPPLFMLFPVLTAPCALGLALWKWRAAPSLVVRTRLRLVLGIILAVLQFAGLVFFWSMVFWFRPQRHP